MNEMVNVNNLCQTFYPKEGELEVLKDINFSLKQGQILTIIGPSGSGKSNILVTHDISEAICYKVQPLIKVV